MSPRVYSNESLAEDKLVGPVLFSSVALKKTATLFAAILGGGTIVGGLALVGACHGVMGLYCSLGIAMSGTGFSIEVFTLLLAYRLRQSLRTSSAPQMKTPQSALSSPLTTEEILLSPPPSLSEYPQPLSFLQSLKKIIETTDKREKVMQEIGQLLQAQNRELLVDELFTLFSEKALTSPEVDLLLACVAKELPILEKICASKQLELVPSLGLALLLHLNPHLFDQHLYQEMVRALFALLIASTGFMQELVILAKFPKLMALFMDQNSLLIDEQTYVEIFFKMSLNDQALFLHSLKEERALLTIYKHFFYEYRGLFIEQSMIETLITRPHLLAQCFNDISTPYSRKRLFNAMDTAGKHCFLSESLKIHGEKKVRLFINSYLQSHAKEGTKIPLCTLEILTQYSILHFLKNEQLQWPACSFHQFAVRHLPGYIENTSLKGANSANSVAYWLELIVMWKQQKGVLFPLDLKMDHYIFLELILNGYQNTLQRYRATPPENCENAAKITLEEIQNSLKEHKVAYTPLGYLPGHNNPGHAFPLKVLEERNNVTNYFINTGAGLHYHPKLRWTETVMRYNFQSFPIQFSKAAFFGPTGTDLLACQILLQTRECAHYELPYSSEDIYEAFFTTGKVTTDCTLPEKHSSKPQVGPVCGDNAIALMIKDMLIDKKIKKRTLKRLFLQ